MKIGLVIKLDEDQTLGRAPSYSEIRTTALAAEESGFDSIWLYDHLLFRNEGPTAGIWECWTTLSALAEATKRVELGTLVMCNPFRNPALLAKMATTLDEVSGGRLILGLGAGWHKPEFEAFGFPFDHRVDRIDEALQIIRPLLREGRVDFEGDYYQAKNCEITPQGPRPQGPPLLLGAFRPRMLQLAAQYADQWNTAWLGQPNELAERLAKLHAACEQVGRDPATLAVTVGVQAVFPDLGETDPWTTDPITGAPGEVAATLKGWEEAGVAHLIVQCSPYSREAQDRLAEAVRIFHG
jgi:probable F420-dependent oxidoreductase